jgi:DNA-binding NarL/FixJ family response regulator
MSQILQSSWIGLRVRILVAEDQAIVRRGIASLLRLTPGFEVAGEAENGVEAVERTLELQPDVVLMDISMPLLNGVDAAAKIKAATKGVKIIMLTAYDGEDLVMRTIASGADGYMLKKATPETLAAAIRMVKFGSKGFYSPSFSAATIQRLRKKLDHTMRQGSDLTAREREVLQLVAEGKSHQEISELLQVSVRTVDTHRNNLMHKLQLHDAVALVRYAVKTGLTQI